MLLLLLYTYTDNSNKVFALPETPKTLSNQNIDIDKAFNDLKNSLLYKDNVIKNTHNTPKIKPKKEPKQNKLTNSMGYKDNVILQPDQFEVSRIIRFVNYKQVDAITYLRQLYNSPAKSLNLVLKETNKSSVELPTFSYAKQKSFVDGLLSESKGQKSTQETDQDLMSWMTNDGKYSKFQNNPVYASKNDDVEPIISNQNNNVFDYDNIETSIITLRINKRIAYDFEAIIWPDGSISLPIKTLAKLVDVPVEHNHVTNTISLIHPISDENIDIHYNKNYINVGTNMIKMNNPKLVWMEQGILVKDDVFVPEKIAKDLVEIDTNFEDREYTLQLATNRPLKALVQITEPAQDVSDFITEEPSSNVKQQKQNKTFNIKNISYSIGSSVNQVNSYEYNTGFASARAGFNATGNLLGGKYNLGANAYQSKNGLSISGYRASLDYLKPKYELSLGSTNTSLSDLTLPNGNIWGLRLGSVGAADSSSTVPRIIEGKADDNSIVELFVNDVMVDKQPAQNGRFEFDSLRYQNTAFVNIRAEQISEAGDRKIVYDRKFSTDSDLLAPGQKQFLVFSGINSSALSNNFRVFGDKFDNSYVQPVKFISGAKYRMGITEELTMGVNVAKDFIIKQPSGYYNTFGNNIAYARFNRTGRSSSGTIVSVDLDYAPSENLRIASELGLSNATSKFNPELDPTGKDFGGFVSFDYNKENYYLKGKFFSYGSDFYSPSSIGLTDKRGFNLAGRYKLGNVNLTGNLTKYSSNLDNYFQGDKFNITTYSLHASGKIDKNSDVRVGLSSSSASNSITNDKNITYDMTLNRRINDKAKLVLNYAKTKRTNNDSFSNIHNETTNNRLNMNFDYDAGKFGIVRLANEMMMLDPVDRLLMAQIDDVFYREPIYSKNIRLTLDRSSLPIKGVTFSPNLGYRYGGQNKGFNFGLNLGYIFRNGRQLGLSYAYNSTFGKYMSGALNFGGSKSHSVSLNFSDNLNFGAKNAFNHKQGPKSSFDNNSGIIKGMVYADNNMNGIKDEEEKGIPGIEVITHNFDVVTTDDNGEYITVSPQGLRSIGIEKDNLPIIYTPTTADAMVKVSPQKVYVANLGLAITPGNISGKVEVNKEGVYNNNVIISLLDKNGKEIKYTTTDSNGEYFIDSIAPGDYNIVIDDNFLKKKGLQPENKDLNTIIIPDIDDDLVIIDNINFNLVPQRAEIKEF